MITETENQTLTHMKSLITVSKWFTSFRTSLGFLSTQDDYTETVNMMKISVRLFVTDIVTNKISMQ